MAQVTVAHRVDPLEQLLAHTKALAQEGTHVVVPALRVHVAQQVQHAQAVLTNPQALEQLLQQIPMLAAVATPMLEHLQDDPGGAFNNMLQHMEVQTQNHLNANPAMAAAAAAVEHQAQGQGGGG